ncbi:hypothetical protein KR222_000649, partial [Zaprionus bogoriensis]
MTNCRSVSTPLDAGYHIKPPTEDDRLVDPKAYQAIIGSLMYLAICTRPDILHSICKLAQMNICPSKEHEWGVKHILRYLS